MRRALGEATSIVPRTESSVEVAEWLESDVFAVATYSAFLSRMVPGEGSDDEQAGAWYVAAMTAWQPFADIPDWSVQSSEAMLDALGRLQTLSWMQRPVVIRNWIVSTLTHGSGMGFTPCGADALRMTCALLDSPPAPELARHHVTLADDTQSPA
jgi:hypothetical protein